MSPSNVQAVAVGFGLGLCCDLCSNLIESASFRQVSYTDCHCQVAIVFCCCYSTTLIAKPAHDVHLLLNLAMCAVLAHTLQQLV